MRVTTCVPLEKKKLYRPTPDECLQLRNIISLYCQAKVYLSAKLDPKTFAEYSEDIKNGNTRDDDFLTILASRPNVLAVSMLASLHQAAVEKAREHESAIYGEVETQRLGCGFVGTTFALPQNSRGSSMVKIMKKVGKPAFIELRQELLICWKQ